MDAIKYTLDVLGIKIVGINEEVKNTVNFKIECVGCKSDDVDVYITPKGKIMFSCNVCPNKELKN